MTDLYEEIIDKCGYVMFNWANCTHEELELCGFDQSGGQMYQCTVCGQRYRPHMRSLFELRAAIGRMLIQPGVVFSDVTEHLMVSQHTVVKVARLLRGRLPDCPCGRPALHLGRCWYRRVKTEKVLITQ